MSDAGGGRAPAVSQGDARGPALPDPATFGSGESGHVAGVRHTVGRRAGDLALDLLQRLRRDGRTLDGLAAAAPRRELLVLCLYRPESGLAAGAARELRRTRHEVRLAFGATGAARADLAAETVASDLRGGKFANLNALVEAAGGLGAADWLLVVDDDVVLPPRFLDRLLGLAEHFGLALAQPAQTLMSHAAWRVTRRRPASLLRETRYIETGPVTLFRRDVADALLPFPPLRYGWGLDLHWSALAEERGWRRGVADALAVRHETQPVASGYGAQEAIAEEQRFLADRVYLSAAAAQETLVTHRRVRRP